LRQLGARCAPVLSRPAPWAGRREAGGDCARAVDLAGSAPRGAY